MLCLPRLHSTADDLVVRRPRAASRPATRATYAFDANGSQQTRTTATSTQTHGYDRIGRLTTVTLGAQTIRFTYDAHDRRIATTRADGTHVRFFSRYAESRDGRLIKCRGTPILAH
jgi:YD repeat-containing protein